MKLITFFIGAFLVISNASSSGDEVPRALRVGRAGHAFDHVGNIGEQADAAAASGATIIYATGLGGYGYLGLPQTDVFEPGRETVTEYNRRAKANGIELSIGYLCATSIVNLKTFDKNWSPQFRGKFDSPPADWRQQDRDGKPLASWYGGDYTPACMSNPNWRAYERAMVGYQLEAGHDGIFFDNPTVHPQGCYCPHCMRKFARFLEREEVNVAVPLTDGTNSDIEILRSLPEKHPTEFLRYRATIASDFLAEMRKFARTVNPQALVTCNNSLNSPGVWYSQCRTYGYDIHELSKVEDYVVVEDMATQPRTESNGISFEYGPTYKLLHAISHGKPIVAVTLVKDDYHTPPNLMRLAMAEAAANNASYLSWPTWPEKERARMIAAVRPQADFLRRKERLLNDAPFRADVLVYLPFRRWLDTDTCVASELATTLAKANMQFRAIDEDSFALPSPLGRLPVLLVESKLVFTPTETKTVTEFEKRGGHVIAADGPDWLAQLSAAIVKPSITIDGPPTVRAIVHDQSGQTIVHVLNLNVQRQSSFEDKVVPAEKVNLVVRVPFDTIATVSALSADDVANSGPLPFTTKTESGETFVVVSVSQVKIHCMIVIRP